jgi:hypothetical protein
MRDTKYRLGIVDEKGNEAATLQPGLWIALINRETGKAISENEPTFLLRAADNNSLDVLKFYHGRMCAHGRPESIRETVKKSWKEFEEWRDAHTDRLKEPD